jgi:diketogulonate reductase-like aldo/keto reductase
MMEPEAAKECIRNSVLNLTKKEDGYIDLVLIHWPTSIAAEPGVDNRVATYKALEEMRD